MELQHKTITINGVEYVEKSEVSAQPQETLEKYKIVRTQNAGVFAGFVESRSVDGLQVKLTNARRLWYWSGAFSLSQLAIDGTSKPNDCKFPEAVAEIELTQVLEIIAVTKRAKKSIDGVKICKV